MHSPLPTAAFETRAGTRLDFTRLGFGGASFHHCRTIHGSGPNRSDHVRRAYINEWQAVPVQRETPKDHPWFWPRYHEMSKRAAERMKPAVEAV